MRIRIPASKEETLRGVYFIESTEQELYKASFVSAENLLTSPLSYTSSGSAKVADYNLEFTQGTSGFFYFYFDSDTYEVELYVDNNGALTEATESNGLTKFPVPVDGNYIPSLSDGIGKIKGVSYSKYSIRLKPT